MARDWSFRLGSLYSHQPQAHLRISRPGKGSTLRPHLHPCTHQLQSNALRSRERMGNSSPAPQCQNRNCRIHTRYFDFGGHNGSPKSLWRPGTHRGFDPHLSHIGFGHIFHIQHREPRHRLDSCSPPWLNTVVFVPHDPIRASACEVEQSSYWSRR